jgi:hypothetical protein
MNRFTFALVVCLLCQATAQAFTVPGTSSYTWYYTGPRAPNGEGQASGSAAVSISWSPNTASFYRGQVTVTYSGITVAAMGSPPNCTNNTNTVVSATVFREGVTGTLTQLGTAGSTQTGGVSVCNSGTYGGGTGSMNTGDLWRGGGNSNVVAVVVRLSCSSQVVGEVRFPLEGADPVTAKRVIVRIVNNTGGLVDASWPWPMSTAGAAIIGPGSTGDLVLEEQVGVEMPAAGKLGDKSAHVHCLYSVPVPRPESGWVEGPGGSLRKWEQGMRQDQVRTVGPFQNSLAADPPAVYKVTFTDSGEPFVEPPSTTPPNVELPRPDKTADATSPSSPGGGLSNHTLNPGDKYQPVDATGAPKPSTTIVNHGSNYGAASTDSKAVVDALVQIGQQDANNADKLLNAIDGLRTDVREAGGTGGGGGVTIAELQEYGQGLNVSGLVGEGSQRGSNAMAQGWSTPGPAGSAAVTGGGSPGALPQLELGFMTVDWSFSNFGASQSGRTILLAGRQIILWAAVIGFIGYAALVMQSYLIGMGSVDSGGANMGIENLAPGVAQAKSWGAAAVVTTAIFGGFALMVAAVDLWASVAGVSIASLLASVDLSVIGQAWGFVDEYVPLAALMTLTLAATALPFVLAPVYGAVVATVKFSKV